MDTTQELMSAIHPGCPWRGPMVDPDGDEDAQLAAASFMFWEAEDGGGDPDPDPDPGEYTVLWFGLSLQI